jgi:hypothetical protein
LPRYKEACGDTLRVKDHMQLSGITIEADATGLKRSSCGNSKIAELSTRVYNDDTEARGARFRLLGVNQR